MNELNASMIITDTIIALATPPGIGAIAVIRVSGNNAIKLTDKIFPSKDLLKVRSQTVHLGVLEYNGQILDEVLVTVFKNPKSYTGEDIIEISCHGSMFIVKSIIAVFYDLGVRYAKPGEFTKRAFMNGKLDLTQAEAVADLIASENKAAHETAINQMRGGFANQLKKLREKLVHFASMIELELDFGEEDVEFADRTQLEGLVEEIYYVVDKLVQSFSLGNVIKNGIPTVIAGKPNAGKSTLLNTLLKEEKAIVSDIPGTTRDFIEDEINIEGINFRFIDTAGLRETNDKVEAIGVQRTYEKMKKAALIIYMFDTSNTNINDYTTEINLLKSFNIPFTVLGNKIDLSAGENENTAFNKIHPFTGIIASDSVYVDKLKDNLLEILQLDKIKQDDTIVTNSRHYESLKNTLSALNDVKEALKNEVTGDLLALDIKQALNHLGEITGEITTDDLLANIFSKFCIGK